MSAHSTVLAIALLAPTLSFAGENYVPKFATPVVMAPAASPVPATSVLPDTYAEILDVKTCPRAMYPLASRRNDETGTSTLRLTIAATGQVVDGVISRSSGFHALDAAALAAMRECGYRPASRNGIPIESTTMQQYIWTLQ
jgi:TonB family protein